MMQKDPHLVGLAGYFLLNDGKSVGKNGGGYFVGGWH